MQPWRGEVWLIHEPLTAADAVGGVLVILANVIKAHDAYGVARFARRFGGFGALVLWRPGCASAGFGQAGREQGGLPLVWRDCDH